MIRSYVKQHKKRGPKEKNTKKDKRQMQIILIQHNDSGSKGSSLARFELKSIQEYSLPKSEVVIVQLQEIAT